MLRAEQTGDARRGLRLVERRIVEADREGPHAARARSGHDRHDQTAVEAARQERAERHVADEPPRHGVADETLAAVDRLPERAPGRALSGGRGRQRPEPALGLLLPSGGGALQDEERSRREMAHAAEECSGSRDVLSREIGVDTQRIGRAIEGDRGGEQGIELRGEDEDGAVPVEVEGLLPGAVAREDEDRPRPIEEREREHPVQARGQVRRRARLFVEVDDRLGVAPGGEEVPAPRQVVAQVLKVVDLAVLDDRDASILVPDRLPSSADVDHGEPAHRQTDASIDQTAFVVRASMPERAPHGQEIGGLHGALTVAEDDAGDAAHGPGGSLRRRARPPNTRAGS